MTRALIPISKARKKESRLQARKNSKKSKKTVVKRVESRSNSPMKRPPAISKVRRLTSTSLDSSFLALFSRGPRHNTNPQRAVLDAWAYWVLIRACTWMLCTIFPGVQAIEAEIDVNETMVVASPAARKEVRPLQLHFGPPPPTRIFLCASPRAMGCTLRVPMLAFMLIGACDPMFVPDLGAAGAPHAQARAVAPAKGRRAAAGGRRGPEPRGQDGDGAAAQDPRAPAHQPRRDQGTCNDFMPSFFIVRPARSARTRRSNNSSIELDESCRPYVGQCCGC